ncbi:MAG: J domain-containing protein [Polyangiaceae bacterium]|jgi:hypothetical protein|nr:J domain-containing protein [Polyangiaceae bacterium]
MFLPGSLGPATLGDVLGRLHRAGISGVLELISREVPDTTHAILLRDGMVTGVQTPLQVARIGEVLRDQGALTAAQHRDLTVRLLGTSGRLAGQVIVDLRLATPGDVARGLSRQMRLRLDAVYATRRAALRFRPLGMGMCSPGADAPRLAPRDFLHGRPRARDRVPDGPVRQALELLGLSPGATVAHVRSAFRREAALSHPDLHASVSQLERDALHARFSELSGAYHLLLERMHGAQRTHPSVRPI